MLEPTAVILIVKPWAGNRIGATIVVSEAKATQLVELKVAEMISKPSGEVLETETASKPMKAKRI